MRRESRLAVAVSMALAGPISAQVNGSGSLSLTANLALESVDLSLRDGYVNGTTLFLYSFGVPDEAAGESGLQIPANRGGGEIGLSPAMILALLRSPNGDQDLTVPLDIDARAALGLTVYVQALSIDSPDWPLSPSGPEPFLVSNRLQLDFFPRGILVTPAGATDPVFTSWSDERTINQAINSLRATDGGEIRLTPGTYEIRQGISIRDVDNVTVTGSSDVKLVFPDARQPFRLLRSAPEGQFFVELDSTDGLLTDVRYQIHNEDGIRILEFVPRLIAGTIVWLRQPIAYMSHVTEIPAGATVREEFNFFRLSGANNITIRDLEMDGRNVGDVVGHTMYCGILSRNQYVPNNTVRSAVTGLQILDNTFRNLRGRGVAAYSVENMHCAGNTFVNISAEAVEVDHYSRATVIDNEFRDSNQAVVMDDAYNTLIQGNRIIRCQVGVAFNNHFTDEWVNRGAFVANNYIEGPGHIGIKLDEHASRHFIGNNVIVGMQVQQAVR